MKMTTKLRRLLERNGIIEVAGVYDALSAKMAEALGFEAIALGGYSLGAHLGIPEPMIGLHEFVIQARYIVNAVDIPLKCDAGAGYGDAVHVMRTVKEFESAGVACIHIEDQVYPKRVGYHLGKIHVIPMEDMIGKIEAALKERSDEDFVIIARTDAISAVGEGLEEGIKRAKAYADAGADMIYIFPQTREQLKIIGREISAPLVFDASVATDLPIYKPAPPTAKELEDAGWKMVVYSEIGVYSLVDAVWETYKNIREQGKIIADRQKIERTRKNIEAALKIAERYDLEVKTGKG